MYERARSPGSAACGWVDRAAGAQPHFLALLPSHPHPLHGLLPLPHHLPIHSSALTIRFLFQSLSCLYCSITDDLRKKIKALDFLLTPNPAGISQASPYSAGLGKHVSSPEALSNSSPVVSGSGLPSGSI